jgi:RNA polymerase sigma-70 factor (ECF subfamily)
MAKKSSRDRRVCGVRGLNRDGAGYPRRFPQPPEALRALRRDKPEYGGHTARMEGPSDHDLMARTAQGDGRAFRTLAQRHAGGALRLARRMLGNDALAEDIVQDAMLRVWTHAPRWRPEAAFRTWLYRVVVNLCLNARRRPADLPLEAAGQVADFASCADSQLEAHERDRRIAAAIGALADRQRAAIVLSYQEGLSNAEVAVMLDTSVSSVETLLVRAKRALRRALGE